MVQLIEREKIEPYRIKIIILDKITKKSKSMTIEGAPLLDVYEVVKSGLKNWVKGK
jgi:hypothetical protein